MPNIRLGTALIFAKDMQRMTEFYHEGLGLPAIPATSAPMFEPKPSGICDGLDPEGNVFSLVPAHPA